MFPRGTKKVLALRQRQARGLRNTTGGFVQTACRICERPRTKYWIWSLPGSSQRRSHFWNSSEIAGGTGAIALVRFCLHVWVLFFGLGIGLKPAEAETSAVDGEVFLDGLAVLAWDERGRESDALPILKSDLEFYAALIAMRRFGPLEGQAVFSDAVRVQARRSAVFVRLLARQAKQQQEVVNSTAVAGLREEIVRLAGGTEAMGRLLRRVGMDDDTLTQWAQNAWLASTQIKYVMAQVDIPSLGKTAPGSGADRAGSGPEYGKDPLDSHRRRILDERMKKTMNKWLADLLTNYHVRIIQ
jgi:hypothetical protein